MAVFIGAKLRALAQNFTPNYLYYIELKVYFPFSAYTDYRSYSRDSRQFSGFTVTLRLRNSYVYVYVLRCKV